ncbi:MAG: 50S ribosomal protein L6 [Desulfobacterales bacterium]|jgi:large subunit ribosomal protein L6|nr:50S ribosomal protein L6 [Desulfobacteraceae bacterium]MBT4364076.1 50S ribosomal protein L6 [Desulfobacteraceae bacterium]MBT7086364.1 50S ribosomal protein L6 [Desulfobacterales bacterium]MBT7696271.1 50S ribosomal protein L6 [Desulfobacterales bacterium]
MSRVGKKPVEIPGSAKVTYKEKHLTIKGDKGKLSLEINPLVDLKIDDRLIVVEIKSDDRKTVALQGLTRSLVSNMIEGVSKGFERKLEINGIGYRAESKGKSVVFNLGYSHPIDFKLPEGISASIDKSLIVLSGIDKQLLGQTAASIRKLRPPEPYKGKGIKYVEEHIQRKAGKTGTV